MLRLYHTQTCHDRECSSTHLMSSCSGAGSTMSQYQQRKFTNRSVASSRQALRLPSSRGADGGSGVSSPWLHTAAHGMSTQQQELQPITQRLLIGVLGVPHRALEHAIAILECNHPRPAHCLVQWQLREQMPQYMQLQGVLRAATRAPPGTAPQPLCSCNHTASVR